MTYQVPPCRPPESLKPAGMTIKQDIEREAERLGSAVRAAAEEFARVTGLRPDINVNWLMHQPLSGRASSLKLTRVSVEVGGLSVEA